MTTALLVLIVLLIVLLIALTVILKRQSRVQALNRQQSDRKIHELETALAAVKSELDKSVKALKDLHGSAEYEAYARLVVSQMDQGVICIDKNRVVRLINTYAEQFLDFAATGKPYRETIHINRKDHTEDYSPFEEAFSGRSQTLPDGTEIVCKRGSFPVSGTILPLMTDGTVSTVVFIFADSSKEIERIKEEQAFFSAAAHELRTPLTVIRMTVSLLKEKYDTYSREKIMEYLKRTDETTERLVKLVNDFLNVSRIDQGRIEILSEPFDMVTLTDEVIRELSMLAKERNLYINHDPIGSAYRIVLGDRSKAKEVLLNLISNSIKYTVQGGLTVTHKHTNSFLATSVADTGGGIPPELQGLLFKRFQQVGGARQMSPTKSSGLGLYISKKFAQLMHGDLVLEKSEPGNGSTFTFTMPLH